MTNRAMGDLRILRLAMDLEDSLERYEESLRDGISEVPVRARLHELFAPSGAHLELKKSYDALAAKAGASKRSFPTEEILQSLLECERVARDFYLNQLDHLSDPSLVELFRALAREEAGHASAVEDALRIRREIEGSQASGKTTRSRPGVRAHAAR